jgi:hypothetical protein
MALKIQIYQNTPIKDGFSLNIVASVDFIEELCILKTIIENQCQSHCMGVTIESLGPIKVKKLYSFNFKSVYGGSAELTSQIIK